MVLKKIYLLVKAYPEKSKKHGSSMCTAGLTVDGEWIRVYPIDLNYYQLNREKLHKWNIIEGDVIEASEKLSRKESYKIRERTIRLIDNSLTQLATSSKKKKEIWNKRNKIILPHLNNSME